MTGGELGAGDTLSAGRSSGWEVVTGVGVGAGMERRLGTLMVGV